MKKKRFQTWLSCTGAILCVVVLAVNAQAWTIDDATDGTATYYGGAMYYGGTLEPTHYNDVIGGTDFTVDGMVVTQVATSSGDFEVKVVLSGPYFTSNYALGAAAGGYRVGNPGDLYISTNGWKVNDPTDHARNDTFDSTEGWDYVMSYSDGHIYELDFGKITPTGSENFWRGYREEQAWRGGYGNDVGTVTVTLDPYGGTLTFTFDVGSGVDVSAWGYHWTMACGNDVVEGHPVTEPTTMLLLGLGLMGLAGARRKMKN